jgi:hypothetical protein
MAGNSDQTVSVHFCEYQGPNIMTVFTFSIIQHLHFKSQPVRPEMICHVAGIATDVPLHYRNYFMYSLIIPCNLLISRLPSRFRSRDIVDIVFRNDELILRPRGDFVMAR